jgi:hypothetical protein
LIIYVKGPEGDAVTEGTSVGIRVGVSVMVGVSVGEGVIVGVKVRVGVGVRVANNEIFNPPPLTNGIFKFPPKAMMTNKAPTKSKINAKKPTRRGATRWRLRYEARMDCIEFLLRIYFSLTAGFYYGIFDTKWSIFQLYHKPKP